MPGEPKSNLLDDVTCPHCWTRFPPSETLWISPTLVGDVRLGPQARRRFLPSRFTPAGDAVDAAGQPCQRLACPDCHLGLPRVLLEHEPWFVSLVGAPGSGKSYYLAAMSRWLRRELNRDYRVEATHADAEANGVIADYERNLFESQRPDGPAPLAQLIKKTQEADRSLHQTVFRGGQGVQLPRPFFFLMRPGRGHAAEGRAGELARVLCLYDNAGESFLPGGDGPTKAMTYHLARSNLLVFLFDPTLNPPFARRLAGPDGGAPPGGAAAGSAAAGQQHMVLTEAAARVRRLANLGGSQKHDKPLVVAVSKLDLWAHLLPGDGDYMAGHRITAEDGRPALDLDWARRTSDAVRSLLLGHAADVVHAAEAFASNVTYVGVSALGTTPTWDAAGGQWCVRPGDINPVAAGMPVVYGLRHSHPGLVPAGRLRAAAGATR